MTAFFIDVVLVCIYMSLLPLAVKCLTDISVNFRMFNLASEFLFSLTYY